MKPAILPRHNRLEPPRHPEALRPPEGASRLNIESLVRAFVLPLMLAAMLVSLPGCVTRKPHRAAKVTAALSNLPYPADAKLGPSLDIVVQREGNDIRIINRTDQPYHHMQLWLNRQYVNRVDDLQVGTGNVFALPRFINQYHEAFPVGSLLAPDKNRQVLSAQLYDPAAKVVYPLIVLPKRPGV